MTNKTSQSNKKEIDLAKEFSKAMENFYSRLKEIATIIGTGFQESIYGVLYDEKKHGTEARDAHRLSIKLISHDYRAATKDEVIDAEALELYAMLLAYGFTKGEVLDIAKQYGQGKIKV